MYIYEKNTAHCTALTTMNASPYMCTSLSISRVTNQQANVGLALSYLLGSLRIDSTGGKMPPDERGDLISHIDSCISFEIQRRHNEIMVVPDIWAFAGFVPAFLLVFASMFHSQCVYLLMVLGWTSNQYYLCWRRTQQRRFSFPTSI
jgi:hypothetical protein